MVELGIKMTFLELATDRYSVRKFDGRPVEEDKIQKILQAGKVAPTAATTAERWMLR